MRVTWMDDDDDDVMSDDELPMADAADGNCNLQIG